MIKKKKNTWHSICHTVKQKSTFFSIAALCREESSHPTGMGLMDPPFGTQDDLFSPPVFLLWLILFHMLGSALFGFPLIPQVKEPQVLIFILTHKEF